MKLKTDRESWKLAQPFTISRGSRTHAEVVVATLEDGGVRGRGEATPYARYGESPESTLAELSEAADRLSGGEPVGSVLEPLKPGAARNALDAAWWDLRCKQRGWRIHEKLGWPPLRSLVTAYTISLGDPAAMGAAARQNAHRPILKIKTGGEQVVECVEAVRRGAPESQLVVDANEAWPEGEILPLLEAMAALQVAFVEQPLPAGRDGILATIKSPVPIFADESFHTSADIRHCLGKYAGVNIKLDKAGGFTEALRALEAARAAKLQIMCGCMLGTSLAMAPAMVIAQRADFIDLDAPLLLAEDRANGIRFNGSTMAPFSAALWG